MTAAYGVHPSPALRKVFESQHLPHQGQLPSEASVVFFGLDANYSPEISETEFFSRIVEYHEDGVAFWQEHGVHHPFLLNDYPLPKNTGGVPYHRKFTHMGLKPEHAPFVSFIELLPVPTTGRTESEKLWEMFDVNHAARIDALIAAGDRRILVVSRSVLMMMQTARKRYGVFEWAPASFKLGELAKIGDTVLWGTPHFSSATSKAVFRSLGEVVAGFCGES